jgi:hypothetical protein
MNNERIKEGGGHVARIGMVLETAIGLRTYWLIDRSIDQSLTYLTVIFQPNRLYSIKDMKSVNDGWTVKNAERKRPWPI